MTIIDQIINIRVMLLLEVCYMMSCTTYCFFQTITEYLINNIML